MKKNIYLRSTFTDIRHSLGRFISIILIIFMGVLLFVGIKSVGPNLEQTATNFLTTSQLSDLQVISTAGLTAADQEAVETIKGAHAELGYSIPYLDEDKQVSLQLYSYTKDQEQNKLRLLKGRLPEKPSEVLLDERLADEYKIGDSISLESDQLKDADYTVTGYTQSPLYVDNLERGSTTVGDGQLDGYVYLQSAAFKSAAYSILYVQFDSLTAKNYFSDAYEDELEKLTDQLDTIFAKRKTERQKELQQTATDQLAEQEQALADNEAKAAGGQAQLDAATVQLTDQKTQLAAQEAQLAAQYGSASAAEQLASEKAQLAAQEEALNAQQAELTASQQQLTSAKTKLAAAKDEIAEIAAPNYILNERSSNPGFNEYTSLSERINAIANVFPVFFFFIAILITFTTMTRMIEENRKEIGTLKALGYRKYEIASKYIVYALLAAFIGTLLGILIGTKFLPAVVFSMLKDQYVFTNFTTNFFFVPILLAVIAALVATLGSSLLVLTRDLHEKPTDLLQPKAPKAGKRVLLEHVSFIWSRMNFNQKVTYRNLFRYKARMVLTILGISGCTGLMLAGFGLKDSISAPADKQFNHLTHYQALVTLTADTAADEDSQVADVLAADPAVTDYLPVQSEQITFRHSGIANQTASLYVTRKAAALQKFVSFSEQTAAKVKLADDGAIISQRLAKIYDVGKGDTLKWQTSDGTAYQLKVAGIAENYLGHNVYMSAAYYKKITGSEAALNTYLVASKTMTKSHENKLSEKLLATDQVLNTTYMSTQIAKQESATASIGSIVWIFIVLSGTLAFVVLYNLTNINISERERELATIKVLGFFDKEVTMYIVRENVIFTVIGILIGFGIGNVLTWFILAMASSDLMSFPLIINWQGYAISAVMTAAFSAIVMGVTHVKLRHIHMIEALKSNE